MTTVRIARPEDPELAALWDEARAAVEQRSPFWQSVAELAAMRNDIPEERRAIRVRTDADCCRGDLRLCRCEPAVREAEPEDDEWMAATGGEE